jgi:hypothetical protein
MKFTVGRVFIVYALQSVAGLVSIDRKIGVLKEGRSLCVQK